MDIFGINIDNRLCFDSYISTVTVRKKINGQFNEMLKFRMYYFQYLAMKTADENSCTVILANDPDSDRMALAEKQRR